VAAGEADAARLESLAANPARWRITRAVDGPSLARLIATGRHDVVVLDLPRRRVDRLLGGLRSAADGRSGMVVLGGAVDRRWTAQAVRAGVRAVLPRDTAASLLRAAIEAVAAGLLVLHPEHAAGLGGTPRDRGDAAPGAPEPLTAREIEVLGMMAEGLGNKLIAARLGISRHTAKFHVASVLGKLGATSRTEAVSRGVRRGLITL
jgi:DNA-binding NarL/FixJ family response regulator